MRVQLGLGLAAGGGAARPSVLASSFVDTQNTIFRRARPLCRNQQIKNSAVRHAEPLEIGLYAQINQFLFA